MKQVQSTVETETIFFSIINYPVRKIGWLDAKIYDRQIDRSEINFLYQLQIQPIALPKFCTAR